MRIPGYLLIHTVIVEPLLGNYSHGPRYGPPVTINCFVEDRNIMILSREGKEVVSTSTVICNITEDVPVESRVTVNGRQSIAMDVKRRDAAGFPAPSHLEVILR